MSAANRGRGQPRRGYRRPKPATRSGAGRLWSRRAACFLWYFLSLRKKVLPPSGRKPHCSRRSRRVNPPESARQSPGVGFLPAKLAHIDAYSWLSARPLQPFGSSAGANQQPNGAASPTPRRSRRVSPPGWGMLPAKSTYTDTDRGSSSGQTTGAACTVVYSVRCLAERRAVPLGNFQTL